MNLVVIPGVKKDIKVTIAKDIIRLEAISNYSRFYLSNEKKLIAAKVLHWFEDTLPAGMFTRLHRSQLVNKLVVQWGKHFH